jgi:hypothetical protein
VSGESTVPTFNHDLSAVVAELTTRINTLQANKDELQRIVDGGKKTDKNKQALEEICESLEAAKNGKILLMNSCCNGQTCDIDYDV